MKLRYNIVCFLLCLSGALMATVTPGEIVMETITTSGVGGYVQVETSGTSATLTPVPTTADGYTFLSWTDGNTDNPRVVTIADGVSVEAVFARTNFPSGTVTVTPNANYASYQLAASESGFVKWSNGVTTSTIAEYAPNQEKTCKVRPVFAANSVVYTNRDGGTVALSGSTITATPTENSDYTFVCWEDNSTDNPRTLSSLSGKYAAVFVRNGFNGGTVSASVSNFATGTYQLTATGEVGFIRWSDGNTTSARDYTEVLENTCKIRPLFISTNLETLITEGVGGNVAVSGTGTSLTLTPSENETDGYSFIGWTDGSELVARAVTAKSGDSYEAVFARTTFAQGTVTVTPNANFASYQLAASESGFVKWSNGVTTSTIADYTPSMEQTCKVRPVFAAETAQYTNRDGGTVAISGSTITATPTENSDYTFVCWEDNSTTNPRTLSSLSGKYAAVFVRNEFPGGKISATVTDFANKTYELSATGCTRFIRWSDGITDASRSYTEASETTCKVRPLFETLAEVHTPESPVCGRVDVTQQECQYLLTAVPNDGYSFKKWSDNNTDIERLVAMEEGEYEAIFDHGVAQIGDIKFATLAEAIASADKSTILLTDNISEDVVLNAGKDITLQSSEHTIAGDLTIACGAKLTLVDDAVVENLYLNSTQGSAAQLVGSSNLTYTNAYMDIAIEAGVDDMTGASGDKWYAIAVPFKVNVMSGIHRKSNPDATLTFGTDYLVEQYDGNARATTGAGWKRSVTNNTMLPGVFYLFAIDGKENIWRFTKADGALEGEDEWELSAFAPTGSEPENQGWNAAGNALLQDVTVEVDALEEGYKRVLTYNNTTSAWVVSQLATSNFNVGTPFFVQSPEGGTISLTAVAEKSTPKRMIEREEIDRAQYEVRISDSRSYDALFITAADDAQDSYAIGRDLGKMRANTVAQLWTTAYGLNLCAQDAVWNTNQEVAYSLSLYAPHNGQFTLSAEGTTEVPLYLTQNGNPIWNLSKAPYAIELTKGTTTDYGLLLVGEKGISTYMQSQTEDGEMMKYIHNGQLYIRYNGLIINAQGGLVK